MRLFKSTLLRLAFCTTALWVTLGATAQHLTENEAERTQIHKDFIAKKKVFLRGNRFSVFSQTMTPEEREAMEFLYAYMPLNDIADYDGLYHLGNVRMALKARREMPWGKVVPEREFRHFVLPQRVNNEDLDSCRTPFYDELKPRIQHLSMRDAVLEVNHWCHEKVTYHPADGRTSSPLNTVRTALGRCGEESTFLVAALRAVGIPARQVYTPRWAHTDDNHAWVEAWVDGHWHFLGACEPEPVLDLGWFNAPASRAMLMHTSVFGHYNGPEEVMSVTPCTTVINVIDNYADNARVDVTVVDADGNPVPGIAVEFKIYNYAEFYTVSRKTTDTQGHTWLSAGLGDMMLFAAKDGRYALQKVSFGQDKAVTLRLDRRADDTCREVFTVTPPKEKPRMPEVSDAQRQENNRRMNEEDAIRTAYVDGVQKHQPAGLDTRGNWPTITRFLAEPALPQTGCITAPSPRDLLSTMSRKDQRDVPLDVLLDHYHHTQVAAEAEVPDARFAWDYIYCPRTSTEWLTPYKQFFQRTLSPKMQQHIRQNPEWLVAWCRKNIRMMDAHNPLHLIIRPRGVWETRTADSRSLGIFFVAVMRSAGMPARLDPVTEKVQYYRTGQWHDVCFDTPENTAKGTSDKGTLVLTYQAGHITDNPKYYTHFSLSALENDAFRLLLYDEDETGLDVGANWQGTFRPGTPLSAGPYLLVSGTRMADGSVLVTSKTLNIRPGQKTVEVLELQEDSTKVAVLGNFNSEDRYAMLGPASDITTGESLLKAQTKIQSLLQTTGRGYYVLGLLGSSQEPNNHALRDISALKTDFEQWGRSIVLLFHSADDLQFFRPQDFPNLPSTVTYGIDSNEGGTGTICQELVQNLKLSAHTLPIFVIADTFNRVVFVSQGYTIGLGEQLKRVINGI